jgi:hypothetical protein
LLGGLFEPCPFSGTYSIQDKQSIESAFPFSSQTAATMVHLFFEDSKHFNAAGAAAAIRILRYRQRC